MALVASANSAQPKLRIRFATENSNKIALSFPRHRHVGGHGRRHVLMPDVLRPSFERFARLADTVTIERERSAERMSVIRMQPDVGKSGFDDRVDLLPVAVGFARQLCKAETAVNQFALWLGKHGIVGAEQVNGSQRVDPASKVVRYISSTGRNHVSMVFAFFVLTVLPSWKISRSTRSTC